MRDSSNVLHRRVGIALSRPGDSDSRLHLPNSAGVVLAGGRTTLFITLYRVSSSLLVRASRPLTGALDRNAGSVTKIEELME